MIWWALFGICFLGGLFGLGMIVVAVVSRDVSRAITKVWGK